MYKELDSLHEKILNSKFAEEVTEQEILALVEAKEIRAKAIDDFANELINHSISADVGRSILKIEFVAPVTRIIEIAEQLKGEQHG